ncbi:MAG: NAD(P)/FAD-dependent oxidoreductase [Pseudomonadota bacterium]|nr:NAD(P)/FAD-dependent oxidoreductase [Pseudomonadota bacterium]
MNHPTPGTDPDHDVIIVGGGLAGLCLALQLRQRFADIDILVLERRSHPVPHATHKVGESSVEIGAHYFEHELGLQSHLESAQLKKFGFRFFFSDRQRDIARVTEIGVSRSLPVMSWQIDRGIFENHLAQVARERGVHFVDGARVRHLQLAEGKGPHCVSWRSTDQAESEPDHRASARWLIDASGRAALLKRQLGLEQENAHNAHAVWFRVAEHIDLDEWSDDPAWRARTAVPTRWLSTNHLVGPGYWVWLIPLASGSHSVGIVADPAYHPLERLNNFERAMQWLAEHQPRLHEALQTMVGSDHSKLQDFAFLRRFSHDCKQVYSAQRWALTGEAGRFLDPFYSPGNDFIAIGNTYIAELIARDRAGKPLAAHALVYDQAFKSFYDSTLTLYLDQYGLFGDPEVLPHKIIWDYSYYWGVLSQLYFQQRLADLGALAHLRDALAHCQRLNAAVQDFLRAWGGHSQRRNPAVMLDQAAMPWFAALNGSLVDKLDDVAFRHRIRESARRMTALAQELLDRGCGEHPQLNGTALKAAIGQAGDSTPRAGEFGPMLFPAAAQLEPA